MRRRIVHVLLTGTLSLLALAIILLPSCPRRDHRALLFFSGAGMKIPVTEITQDFTAATGIPIDVHFEGSSVLRRYIELYGDAHLFLSGDSGNIDILEHKGLVRERKFVAWHIPSILVPPENSKNITGLIDLARPDVRFVMSNPEQASLGKMVHGMLLRHPRGRAILNNVAAYGSSTQDDLRIFRELHAKGRADAVIEWDVMVHAPEGKELKVVPFEKEHEIKDAITIALLATPEASKTAKRFYDYFTTEGRAVFKKHGYTVEAEK